jgi:Protein adenylyltransferase SelO
MDEYQSIMTRKLGLTKYNKQLISRLLNNLAVDKVDYTNFFRLLSNVKADPTIPEKDLLTPLKAALLDIGKERKEAWTSWLQTYIEEVPFLKSILLMFLDTDWISWYRCCAPDFGRGGEWEEGKSKGRKRSHNLAPEIK